MDQIVSFRDETQLGELVLKIRHENSMSPDRSAALILDGAFLMDSKSCASEFALARRGVEEALARISIGEGTPEATARTGLRVLVGGLGLGLTLCALLEFEAVGDVRVIELFESLIDWNRLHLSWLNKNALADKRVFCQAGDLVTWLSDRPRDKTPPDDKYDLILLDIDNGPTWLSRPENKGLYSEQGLVRLLPWLSPRGITIFWSTEIAPEFESKLSSLSWAKWWREIVPCEAKGCQKEMADVLYYVCLDEE